MRGLRGGLVAATFGIGLLAAPSAPAAVTFDQSAPLEARTGNPVTFTMTVGNTGVATEAITVGMLGLRAGGGPGGGKAVNNPYQSFTGGSCAPEPVDSYGYHAAECQVTVPAGGTAQITATIQLNGSTSHWAGIQDPNGAISGPSETTTVWAIYPPRTKGSSKIKVKGLPEGCVDRNLELTISSKSAKKITASLAGVYDEWHGRLDGFSFSGKIATEKGGKMKLKVPLGEERAGHYDLKLAAKFNNGPKLKKEITLQRCGAQEGL